MRAEGERARGLAVRRAHDLALRDLQVGELREAAAADDRAASGHSSFMRADLRQVAPEALRVHAAAEHEAVGDLQADEIGA